MQLKKYIVFIELPKKKIVQKPAMLHNSEASYRIYGGESVILIRLVYDNTLKFDRISILR
jgi:hypothetical protein